MHPWSSFIRSAKDHPIRFATIGGALLWCVLLVCCGGGSGTAPAAAAPSVPPPSTPTPPGSTPAPHESLLLGAQTHFAQGWSRDLMPRLSAAGLATVRDELYWQLVEPQAGRFSFPRSYDDYMAALVGAGIDPLIELDFENTNYDGGQTPYTDAGVAAYARYAAEVLRHYGDKIHAVEIWNEFNGSFAKGPATADRPASYLKLLRAAYAAIKAARPDVTVVGGATAGVPLPYFEKLFAAGALDYLDAVSIHPYRTATTPEGVEAQVAALHDLLARHGHASDRPIWVTEIGWNLHPPAAPGDLNIDEAAQARFLVRAFALLISAHVPRVYWYLFRDDNATPTMGLVRNDAAFTPRQSFTALQVMNGRLRGATPVGRETTAPDVYSVRFTAASGRELRVAWALAPRTLGIPAGTTVTGLLGESVAVTGGAIRLGDTPVYVAGPCPALAATATGRAATPLTDATSSFSDQQGDYGWFYGVFVGASVGFVPLPGVRTTDWRVEWTGLYPAVSLTAEDQHPALAGKVPVSAVRRWVSTYSGQVRVRGSFRVGTQGDGVGVRILVDGQAVYAAALGRATSIVGAFDFTCPVRTGSTLDFAVDPGPGTDINYDATQLTAAVETAGP